MYISILYSCMYVYGILCDDVSVSCVCRSTTTAAAMVVEELKLRNATVPYHLRDPLEILGERDFQPARQIPEDVQVHNHLPVTASLTVRTVSGSLSQTLYSGLNGSLFLLNFV